MTDRLVIIGASGLGREVYSIAEVAGIAVKGFLDSRTDILDSTPGYPPLLGSPEDYGIEAGDVFVCAVGDADQRRRYVDMFAARGARFVSVVHPTAIFAHNASIGEGCIVRQYAVIGSDARIGNHVQVGPLSTVAHDCVLEDYVTVSPGCNIAGWCRLREGVFLGVQSAVVPRAELGRGVFVAAGAAVVSSFESGRLMGVPAREKKTESV